MLTGALGACAGTNGRLGEHPSREGSRSNLVVNGYFTTLLSGKVEYSRLPAGYRIFYTDKDESVIFVAVLEYLRSGYRLKGVLRQPGGASHGEFTREVPPFIQGGPSRFYTNHEFPMSSLKDFPGEWHLHLFADEQQVGDFEFRLRSSSGRP